MARILVIEDNPDNLELMTYLLRAYGHRTFSAGDGELGLAAARLQLADLVVCDVHLPGIDGYGVARVMKSDPALKSIPLLAVTALAMAGDRDRVMAAGFDGYIAKPIEPGTFVADVDAFLDESLRGAAPDPGAAGAEPANAPRRVERGTVLVVDDSPTNRELINETLTPFGYTVRAASSVKAGLEIAATLVPDLILSDLHMPDEDGFALIRRVKADPRLANVPLVFISSSIWGERDRQSALALGVDRFLLRPIEPQALIREIVTCLAEHRERSHGEDPRG